MMTKRAMCILLALVLAVLLPVSAAAAGPIQTDRPAGMTIEYLDQGTPLVGVQFRIYQIAEVDAYGELTVTSPFDRYPIRLDGNTEEDWLVLGSTLEGYILRDEIPASDWGETDEQGRVEFPNQTEYLEQGLYLVMGQRHVQAGAEYEMQPFLVLLPTMDETTNDWNYVVTVRPKFIKRNPDEDDETVKRSVLKIWECSCETPCHPDQIEVQLLRDGEVYETVILNDENDWSYSWEDLDASYEWQIVENVPEGYTVTITRTGITFLVVNTCEPETPPPTEPTEPTEPGGGDSPQTGQLNWPVPVMAFGGIFCLCLGMYLSAKGKKEEE